jgi:hypothetical protein
VQFVHNYSILLCVVHCVQLGNADHAIGMYDSIQNFQHHLRNDVLGSRFDT